jgi:ribosome-binding protein aMBF1 (putative translation factor)
MDNIVQPVVLLLHRTILSTISEVVMVTIAIRKGSDLGRAIAELRRRRGMDQADLAARTGLTADYLSKIESGRTSSILEHELRVLRRLGATITIEVPDG